MSSGTVGVLALQGDVIQSRIPAPRNITEIGGYLNLLQTLGQAEMRTQTLAGALGVAGPGEIAHQRTGLEHARDVLVALEESRAFQPRDGGADLGVRREFLRVDVGLHPAVHHLLDATKLNSDPADGFRTLPGEFDGSATELHFQLFITQHVQS